MEQSSTLQILYLELLLGPGTLYSWWYNRGKYTFRVSSNFIVEREISIFYLDHKTLTLMEMIRDVIKMLTESRDPAPELQPASPRSWRRGEHGGHHCYGTSGRSRAPLRRRGDNRVNKKVGRRGGALCRVVSSHKTGISCNSGGADR